MQDDTSSPVRKIEEYSPDSLLTGYSRTRVAAWLGVAVIVHIVIIGLFSLDRWIQLGEGEAVGEAQTESAEWESEAAAGTETTETTAAPSARRGAEPDNEIPADRRGAPVARRITDVADPSELPTAGDIDLSIQETSPW